MYIYIYIYELSYVYKQSILGGEMFLIDCKIKLDKLINCILYKYSFFFFFFNPTDLSRKMLTNLCKMDSFLPFSLSIRLFQGLWHVDGYLLWHKLPCHHSVVVIVFLFIFEKKKKKRIQSDCFQNRIVQQQKNKKPKDFRSRKEKKIFAATLFTKVFIMVVRLVVFK